MPEEIAFNPFDPSFGADPYPYYKPLRAGPPWRAAAGFPVTLVARYADVVAVARNHTAFWSVFPQGVMPNGSDPFEGAPTMPFSDPPIHSRLRRLVARDFSPRRIAELAPRIDAIASRLLDENAGGAKFEAMSGFADQLPVIIIAEMLGIPAEHHALSQMVRRGRVEQRYAARDGRPRGPRIDRGTPQIPDA